MRRRLSLVLSLLAVGGICLVPFVGVAVAAKKPSLSYGKAQAEAQKSTSAQCSADAECQYWAAACARTSPSAFTCIDSTWNPGVLPSEWIRCDSELTVKALRYSVQVKPVLGSVQCYTTRE